MTTSAEDVESEYTCSEYEIGDPFTADRRPFRSACWFMPVVRIPGGPPDVHLWWPKASGAFAQKIQVARLTALAQGWGTRVRLQRLIEDLDDVGITFGPTDDRVQDGAFQLYRRSDNGRSPLNARAIAWTRLRPDTPAAKLSAPDGKSLTNPEDITVHSFMRQSGADFFLKHLCCQDPTGWVSTDLVTLDVPTLLSKRTVTADSQRISIGDLNLRVSASIHPAMGGAGIGVPDPPRHRKRGVRVKNPPPPMADSVAIGLEFWKSHAGAHQSLLWSIPQVFYEVTLLNWRNVTDQSVSVWGVQAISNSHPIIHIPRLTKAQLLSAEINSKSTKSFVGSRPPQAVLRIRLASRFLEPVVKCLVPGDFAKRRSQRATSPKLRDPEGKTLSDKELDELAKRVNHWSPLSWNYESVVPAHNDEGNTRMIATIEASMRPHCIKRSQRFRLACEVKGTVLPLEYPVRHPGDVWRRRFGHEDCLVSNKPMVRQLRNLMPWFEIGCLGSASEAWSALEPIIQATLFTPNIEMVLSFLHSIHYRTVMRAIRNWMNEVRAAEVAEASTVSVSHQTMKAFGLNPKTVILGGLPSDCSGFDQNLGGGLSEVEKRMKLCLPTKVGLEGHEALSLPTFPVLLVATVKGAMRAAQQQPTRRIPRKWILRIVKATSEVCRLQSALEVLDVYTLLQTLRPTLIAAIEACYPSLMDGTETSATDSCRNLVQTFLCLDEATLVLPQNPSSKSTNSTASTYSSSDQCEAYSSRGFVNARTLEQLMLPFDLSSHASLESLITSYCAEKHRANFIMPDGEERPVTTQTTLISLPVELGIMMLHSNGEGEFCPNLSPDEFTGSLTVPEFLDLTELMEEHKTEPENDNLTASVTSEPNGTHSPLPEARSRFFLTSILAAVPVCGSGGGSRLVSFVKDSLTGTWSASVENYQGMYPLPQSRPFIDSLRSKSTKPESQRSNGSTAGVTATKLAPEDPRTDPSLMQFDGLPCATPQSASVEGRTLIKGLEGDDRALEDLLLINTSQIGSNYWTFNRSLIPLHFTYIKVDHVARVVAMLRAGQDMDHTVKVLPLFFDPPQLQGRSETTPVEDEGSHNRPMEYAALAAVMFNEGIDVASPNCEINDVFQKSDGRTYDWSLNFPVFDEGAITWRESSFPPVLIDKRRKRTCQEVRKQMVEKYKSEGLDISECEPIGEDANLSVFTDDDLEDIYEPSCSDTSDDGGPAPYETPNNAKWTSFFKNNMAPSINDLGESLDECISMASDGTGEWEEDVSETGEDYRHRKPQLVPSTVVRRRQPPEEEIRRKPEGLPHSLQGTGGPMLPPHSLMETVSFTTHYKAQGHFAERFNGSERSRSTFLAPTSGNRFSPEEKAIDIFLVDDAQAMRGINCAALRSVIRRPRWAGRSAKSSKGVGPVPMSDDFDPALAFMNSGHEWLSSGGALGELFSTEELAVTRLQSLPITFHVACRRKTEVADLALLLSLLHGDALEESALYAYQVKPMSGGSGQVLWTCGLQPMQPLDLVDSYVTLMSTSHSKNPSSLTSALFVLGVKKPGSLLGSHFVNIYGYIRHFATANPNESLQHALELLKDDDADDFLPHTSCAIEEGTILLFLKGYYPGDISSIYLGTLMVRATDELNEYSTVIQLAMKRTQQDVLGLRRDVVTCLLGSLQAQSPAHARTRKQLEALKANLEVALEDIKAMPSDTSLMFFQEHLGTRALSALPQKYVTCGQMFKDSIYASVVVQQLPPNYELCGVCRRGMPIDLLMGHQYGCCSESCEVLFDLAVRVRSSLPLTLKAGTDEYSVPRTVEVVITDPEVGKDLMGMLGEYKMNGDIECMRPVYEHRGHKGVRKLMYDSKMMGWKIIGSIKIEGAPGLLAISDKIAFTISPTDLSQTTLDKDSTSGPHIQNSKWFVATSEGFESIPSFAVVAREELEDPAFRVSLSCEDTSILAFYGRTRLTLNDKPVYCKVNSDGSFAKTAVVYDNIDGNWKMVVGCNPSLSLISCLLSRQYASLLTSRYNRLSIGPGGLDVDWNQGGRSRLNLRELDVSILWTPMLLTVHSTIPDFPSGDYVLRRSDEDNAYVFSTSPSAEEGATGLAHKFSSSKDSQDGLDGFGILSLRIIDLAGHSMCLGPICDEELSSSKESSSVAVAKVGENIERRRQHMVICLRKGSRRFGIWKPVVPVASSNVLADPKEDETGVQSPPALGEAHIMALADLPLRIFLVASGEHRSLRGVFWLLDRLYNFRPIYVRLPGLKTGEEEEAPRTPVSGAWVDNYVRERLRKGQLEEPVLFTHYSAVTETWRLGSVVGGGEAILESACITSLHHPAATLSVSVEKLDSGDAKFARKGKVAQRLSMAAHALLYGEKIEPLTVVREGLTFVQCGMELPILAAFVCFADEEVAVAHSLQVAEVLPVMALERLCRPIQDALQINSSGTSQAATIPSEGDWDDTGDVKVKGKAQRFCDLNRFRLRRQKAAVWRRQMANFAFNPPHQSIGRHVRERYKKRWGPTQDHHYHHGEVFAEDEYLTGPSLTFNGHLAGCLKGMAAELVAAGARHSLGKESSQRKIFDLVADSEISQTPPPTTVDEIMKQIESDKNDEADSGGKKKRKRNRKKKSASNVQSDNGADGPPAAEEKTMTTETQYDNSLIPASVDETEQLGGHLLTLILENGGEMEPHTLSVLAAKHMKVAALTRRLRHRMPNKTSGLLGIIKALCGRWIDFSNREIITMAGRDVLVRSIWEAAVNHLLRNGVERSIDEFRTVGSLYASLSEESSAEYLKLLLASQQFTEGVYQEMISIGQHDGITRFTHSKHIEKLCDTEDIFVWCLLRGQEGHPKLEKGFSLVFRLHSPEKDDNEEALELEKVLLKRDSKSASSTRGTMTETNPDSVRGQLGYSLLRLAEVPKEKNGFLTTPSDLLKHKAHLWELQEATRVSHANVIRSTSPPINRMTISGVSIPDTPSSAATTATSPPATAAMKKNGATTPRIAIPKRPARSPVIAPSYPGASPSAASKSIPSTPQNSQSSSLNVASPAPVSARLIAASNQRAASRLQAIGASQISQRPPASICATTLPRHNERLASLNLSSIPSKSRQTPNNQRTPQPTPVILQRPPSPPRKALPKSLPAVAHTHPSLQQAFPFSPVAGPAPVTAPKKVSATSNSAAFHVGATTDKHGLASPGYRQVNSVNLAVPKAFGSGRRANLGPITHHKSRAATPSPMLTPTSMTTGISSQHFGPDEDLLDTPPPGFGETFPNVSSAPFTQVTSTSTITPPPSPAASMMSFPGQTLEDLSLGEYSGLYNLGEDLAVNRFDTSWSFDRSFTASTPVIDPEHVRPLQRKEWNLSAPGQSLSSVPQMNSISSTFARQDERGQNPCPRLHEPENDEPRRTTLAGNLAAEARFQRILNEWAQTEGWSDDDYLERQMLPDGLLSWE